MKKPNKKNEKKPVSQKPKSVSPKNKQITKEVQKSLVPDVTAKDVKKSIIQKIEEKMSLKKKDKKTDLSKIADNVLIVFITIQAAVLVYLLVK